MNFRRFYLLRHEDKSGVSGVGIVAHGVVFPNGKVAVAWDANHPSVAIYDSYDDAVAVHGHSGTTEFVMIDGGTDA